MEETIQQLTSQLLQKDEMMAVMKNRTRDFVHSLKEEHSTALKNLELELSKRSEVCNAHGALKLPAVLYLHCVFRSRNLPE
jgi:hypothetical protein